MSAIFLAFAIAIYILLWREHNIHGWTQFSFLLALFCTYFIAGLRRLIGFEELYAYNLASTFGKLIFSRYFEIQNCICSGLIKFFKVYIFVMQKLWRISVQFQRLQIWSHFRLTSFIRYGTPVNKKHWKLFVLCPLQTKVLNFFKLPISGGPCQHTAREMG